MAWQHNKLKVTEYMELITHYTVTPYAML